MMDCKSSLIETFINENFKRINTIHVLHRASIVSVGLFIIYIFDNPDPFYFFLLAVFILASWFTSTPRRYFKFTMSSMTVKPIKDISTYKPSPYYWVKMPANNIRADMYDELYSSLQNVPNDVVSKQIQKIDSLRGYLNYYDLLNIVLMLMAADRCLYNDVVKRFNFYDQVNR